MTPHIRSIPAKPSVLTWHLWPNVHLIVDGDEGALIDSGFADKESLKTRLDYLQSLPGLRLRYIVLTHHHFDHSSGAHRLRKATGAHIVIHPQEKSPLLDWKKDSPQDIEVPEGEHAEQIRRFRREAARAKPDQLAEDGQLLPVGGLTLEVIHTPGHTMGSICLYLREEKALFTGDTVLGLGTVVVSPAPFGDMTRYLQSLERLKTYDVALLLPGHGPAVKEGRRKLQELIDHRHAREEEILRLLGRGKTTVEALVSAIYPELDRRVRPMANRQIQAHLEKLTNEGRVTQATDGQYAPV
ncbi:MAG TPA: MBL fold metallo-hydrolase [Dehalococcoidia bacterium]|nr:MBL fold metallo-hydrolase [Dehalococcoidia bacterium]